MIKDLVKSMLPGWGLRWYRYHFSYEISRQRRIYRKIVRRVRRTGHANVIFLASSLGMWRYEEVVKALVQDEQFSVLVVIHPFASFCKEEQEREIGLMTAHFDAAGIDYVVANAGGRNFSRIKSDFKPDIIFYPQPYEDLYDESADWRSNTDCLLAYMPYCLHLAAIEWTVNTPMQNKLWRHYMATDYHRRAASKLALNRAENVVVVGEPRADELRQATVCDPWKKINDGHSRKRIIWAPHFQIMPNGWLNRPEFLWMAGLMVELAREYEDKIQIAFKPHPRLRTMLYEHEDWGRKRTDRYYALWDSMPNTQLESGEYVDLFKTSDAMIHNCASFIGEYLYTLKPVAFVSRNLDEVKAPFHEFGERCLDGYYIEADADGIRAFVDEVVLKGDDPMASVRRKIYDAQMRPVNGRTVAENIYDDLTSSLFKKKKKHDSLDSDYDVNYRLWIETFGGGDQ